MVKNLALNSKNRIDSQKGADVIPAVLYGRGIKNEHVWVNRKEFDKIYEEAGESTIFHLALENGDTRNVLIKEVQKDILSSQVIHADFYQVRMDEKIEAEVEFIFTGESAAVKELGGILVKNMDAIEVKCLPGDLPSKIEVDISRLKTFDDYIYVKDLAISDKVEISVDPETVVALVASPRSEEELAELETEVKEDVTKVEGVVKEEKSVEGSEDEEKEEEKKE